MIQQDKSGWVYLLRCGWHHKIGKSKNVRQRVSDMQTANPYLIELVLAVWSDNMARAESSLHENWKSYRTNGEWFEFSPDMLEFVEASFYDIARIQSTWRIIDEDWDIEEISDDDLEYPPWPTTPEMRILRYRGKQSRYTPANRIDPAFILGAWVYDAEGELEYSKELCEIPDEIDETGIWMPRPGDRVSHCVFGEGIVTRLEKREEGWHEAHISFADKVRRIIVALAGDRLRPSGFVL